MRTRRRTGALALARRARAHRPSGLGRASRRDWWEAAALWLGVALVAAPLGSAGFLGPPDPSWDGLGLALRAALVPALAEEALFRLPVARCRRPRVAVASLAAFWAWHLVGGLAVAEARPVLWDPTFLGLAALLGLACTISAWRARTIWPAVAIHWAVVAGWALIWGGPAWLRLAGPAAPV